VHRVVAHYHTERWQAAWRAFVTFVHPMNTFALLLAFVAVVTTVPAYVYLPAAIFVRLLAFLGEFADYIVLEFF
jgi:hypothetical protein